MSVVSGDLPEDAERLDLDLGDSLLAAVSLAPPGPVRGSALLVPGFTGSKEDFSLILPDLAVCGYHCFAIDQRGQHESEGWSDPAAYSVDRLAQDVCAIGAALPAPVHLVGHSFGGLVARAAVLADARRFSSLVLMSSGPAGLSGPRVLAMEAVRPLVVEGRLTEVADIMDQAAALDPRRAVVSAELRAFLRRRFLASAPAGMLGMGDALVAEPDRVDALRDTGLPVLVLHGELDDAWTPAVQQDMAVRLGADYCVVPGAMHSPAVEQPALTAAALLRFWMPD